jgi:uncharacterized protein YbjT (DUF2867 family)
MYVITGATGNTGKPITHALLDAGKKVRIISRSAEKARELTDKGAELFEGDSSDTDLLTKAFEGATAVYVMIPADFYAKDYTTFQLAHANAIAKALETNKVPYAVTLSSQGAHIESGNGVVRGLHHMEKMLDAIDGLNTLHLRPTYFMENTLGLVGVVKHAGVLGSPVRADLKFPVIATRDIAEYAIKRLLSLDFTGNNFQDLLGARDVTYSEMATVYGTAIGKPDLQYVRFPDEDFKKSFTGQMGFSASAADNMLEFVHLMNEGKATDSKRTPESTTPTGIEDFASTFAFVYNM